ncbi:hypothetical protein ACWDWO_20095 [Actinopolymorpha singaporensis]|uniref:Uncharacterized protein n=1 Tax=Actinopolymorpha singaporensis TaxID=117157 RepID=A0A1H1L9J3_9ACTN|nr:hypothetical protein [Actinopolymorpha singaporensis]SDR71254.1 hypothetical protein SAMN04489717_0208 [Actinopolymorpha singaporensis]
MHHHQYAAERTHFRAADGSRVTLCAPGYDLTEPWSASVRITTNRPYAGTPEGLDLRHLHIARAGNYDHVLERVVDGHWSNVVQMQGGQCMIGHSDSADQGLAVWRGPWHEAATWLPDPKMPGSHVLRYFAGLGFHDSPHGLRVIAARPAVHNVEVLEVSKRVPEVGHLDIRQPALAHRLVPVWSGAPVPTGEVWAEEVSPWSEKSPAGSDMVVIHATPSTVTTLPGEGDHKHLCERRVEFLHRVTEMCWARESTHKEKWS